MKKFWKSKTIWNNLIAIAAIAYQSQAGYFAPIETQAVLLAVSNIVLRGITGQPIDWSQIKLPGGKLPAALLLFALGFGTLFLSGCSTLKVIDEQPVLSEFAVRVAVGRFLDEHPQWAASTQQISANAIRLVNEGDEVALPELARYIKTQIPWESLTWEEELQIDLLIDMIASEIVSALPPVDVGKTQEIRVRAATVLGWIHQVAEICTLRRSAAIEWPTVAPTVASAMQTRTMVRECKAAVLAAMRLHGDQHQLQASYLCLDEAEDQLTLAAVEQAAAAADRKFGL